MPDGSEVEKLTLSNGKISVELITYGATLISLKVPDKEGRMTEVLLGRSSLEEYMAQDKFLGAVVGRYANRIANASFKLNGKEYRLNANDGINHLHGGPKGCHALNWTVISHDETSALLGLVSQRGDEGYPGRLEIKLRYSLSDSSLLIEFEAESDEDTVCNLTSHAYFNLSGDITKSIEDHLIRIYADSYTPTDEGSIPTGEIASVTGTPFDLRTWTRISDHIDDDCVQLQIAGGYDHNYVINGEAGQLRKAASVYSKESGIRMDFSSNQAGMQFYSGNSLDGKEKRTAFCLESQAFPDSPNKKNFPSCILKKGESYKHIAVFGFKTE